MAGPDSEFVIQQHSTPEGIHWDLMLQRGDVLWTWRMTISPEHINTACLPIERIVDHPLRFLSYEGPVQNKTGQVKIADKGSYRLISEKTDSLCIDVQGKILQRIFTLTRQTEKFWILARQDSV
ncbi:MAG TPA: DNA polymerase ligase N-terminal domain-containing protein [Anaerohalosphaeraceae bacterium]|nr:DNA polymerase ligase N-terminal domain-containing protein [Anaerohalosphaeraceae bacterium]